MQQHDIKELLDALEKWAREKSVRLTFEPPVPVDELAALEAALGRQLPNDLREALQIHNGGAQLGNYGLIEASRIQRRIEQGLEMAEEPSSSNGTCRPVKWSIGWIPFAEDGALNFLCIDLDPGPRGTVGQVIYWERSDPGADASRWKSFGDWLAAVVADCTTGAATVDPDGSIFLSLPVRSG